MKQIAYLTLAILVLFGCEMRQDVAKNSPEGKVVEEESFASVGTLPGSLDSEVAALTSAVEKLQATSEEIEVQAIVLAKEDQGISVNMTSEQIISDNRWGFSIYDPESNIIEYYTREGGYLGKRAVQ